MKSSRMYLILMFCLFSTGWRIDAAPGVNYDTAWTFAYDGGRDSVTGNMAINLECADGKN